MVRLVGAVGTFVLGLYKKRKIVPHQGLQHVGVVPVPVVRSYRLYTYSPVLQSEQSIS